LGTVLGFEKQFEECRVGEILGGRGEHDLDQARHLDLAQLIRVVDERDPPDLDVVLGRDRDLQPCLDAVVRAHEQRLVGEERHPVTFRLATHGLMGRRPQQAAGTTEINELTARSRSGVTLGVTAVPASGATTRFVTIATRSQDGCWGRACGRRNRRGARPPREADARGLGRTRRMTGTKRGTRPAAATVARTRESA
jgi:hypothetical protein